MVKKSTATTTTMTAWKLQIGVAVHTGERFIMNTEKVTFQNMTQTHQTSADAYSLVDWMHHMPVTQRLAESWLKLRVWLQSFQKRFTCNLRNYYNVKNGSRDLSSQWPVYITLLPDRWVQRIQIDHRLKYGTAVYATQSKKFLLFRHQRYFRTPSIPYHGYEPVNIADTLPA